MAKDIEYNYRLSIDKVDKWEITIHARSRTAIFEDTDKEVVMGFLTAKTYKKAIKKLNKTNWIELVNQNTNM